MTYTAATDQDYFVLGSTEKAVFDFVVAQINPVSGEITETQLASVPSSQWAGGSILAANESFLCLARGPFEVFDRTAKKWLLTQAIPSNASLGVSNSRVAFPYTTQIFADNQGNFWGGGEYGLFRYNPKTGQAQRWDCEESAPPDEQTFTAIVNRIEARRKQASQSPTRPRTRLSAPIASFAMEGNLLSICMSDGSALLLDATTTKVTSRAYVGRYITRSIVSNGSLWVAGGEGLNRRDRNAFKNEWNTLEFSADEIRARLAQMSLTERATYYLLERDPSKARLALTPAVAESKPDKAPVHLLLMALTFDPANGEGQKRTEYLQKLIGESGEIGAFARKEIRRMSIEEPSGAFLAKYDLDKNGVLSPEERMAFLRDPEIVALRAQASDDRVKDFIARFDRDHDGELDFSELMQLEYQNSKAYEEINITERPSFWIARYDSDHNRKLSLGELTAAANKSIQNRRTNGPGPILSLPPGLIMRTNGISLNPSSAKHQ